MNHELGVSKARTIAALIAPLERDEQELALRMAEYYAGHRTDINVTWFGAYGGHEDATPLFRAVFAAIKEEP